VKLEFLRDGAADCPLIRLYHFDKTEVRRLKAIFDSLSTGVLREVALHFEPGIDAVDGCQLYLNVGKSDSGFAERERLIFDGKLTTTTWADVASLASPSAPKTWRALSMAQRGWAGIPSFIEFC